MAIFEVLLERGVVPQMMIKSKVLCELITNHFSFGLKHSVDPHKTELTPPPKMVVCQCQFGISHRTLNVGSWCADHESLFILNSQRCRSRKNEILAMLLSPV